MKHVPSDVRACTLQPHSSTGHCRFECLNMSFSIISLVVLECAGIMRPLHVVAHEDGRLAGFLATPVPTGARLHAALDSETEIHIAMRVRIDMDLYKILRYVRGCSSCDDHFEQRRPASPTRARPRHHRPPASSTLHRQGSILNE